MAGAIHSLITADNSDFRASLAAMETDTGRAMGRVGGIVKTQTRGWRDLSGSILGVTAVTGLAAGAAVAATRGVIALLDTQERVTQAVRAERAERDHVIASAIRMERSLRVQLGLLQRAPNYDNARAVIDGQQAELKRLEEHAKGLEETVRGLQSVGLEGLGDWWDGTSRKATAARSAVDALAQSIGRNILLLERADELDRRAHVESRVSAQMQKIGMESRLRGGLARNDGKDSDAQHIDERRRYTDEIDSIRKLEEAEGRRFTATRELADRFHQSEMDRIGREAEARERALRLSNELAGKTMDAEEARLNGDKERARILEEEVRLRREIEAIRGASGMSEAHRAEREAQAARISAKRLGQVDAPRGDIVSASLESGVQRTGTLLGQVFGGAGRREVHPATEDSAKKQTTIQEGIAGMIQSIMRDGLSTTAVFS